MMLRVVGEGRLANVYQRGTRRAVGYYSTGKLIQKQVTANYNLFFFTAEIKVQSKAEQYIVCDVSSSFLLSPFSHRHQDASSQVPDGSSHTSETLSPLTFQYSVLHAHLTLPIGLRM